MDEFYRESVIASLDSLAQMCVWVDRHVVDALIGRFSAFALGVGGTVLRQFQTGKLQAYAALLVVGLGGIGYFIVRPQPAVRTSENHSTGAYVLTAAPGFGYSYRWDVDGTDGWDGEFGSEAEAKFNLKADEARTVKLEVQNALGQTSVEELAFVRPRVDMSAAGPVQQAVVVRGRDGKARAVSDPEKLRKAREQGAL